MPKRPLAPMTTAQAKEAALLAMWSVIESAATDEVERFKLQTTFVSLCLSLRAQKVLTAILVKAPELQQRMMQISAFLDESMASDPQHFLHAILDAPQPEVV